MAADTSLQCIFNPRNYTLGNHLEQSKLVEKDFVRLFISHISTIVFVLTTNLMLIYGFYKTSRPFTIITKLFIYLSMVDIAYILLRTFYMAQGFLNLKLPCLMVYIVIVFMEFTYTTGIVTFATISFLRYWSIKKPLHTINTSRIIFVLIVQAVFLGLLSGSLLIGVYFHEPQELIDINYIHPITLFLATAFVLTVNITSYKKLKSMERINGFSDNVEDTSTQRQKSLSEANTCLLYITVFYIICPLPLFIANLVLDQLLSFNWGFYLFTFTQMVNMTNPGINSLIAIMRTKNLREFYETKYRVFKRKVSFNSQNDMDLNGVELNRT